MKDLFLGLMMGLGVLALSPPAFADSHGTEAAAGAKARVSGQQVIANVRQYALDMRTEQQFAHFFKLDRTAPNGCVWVFVPGNSQGSAVSFLISQIRNQRVAFRLTSPSQSFEGQPACRVRQIKFGGL